MITTLFKEALSDYYSVTERRGETEMRERT